MANPNPDIRLYGAERCHKTQFYMEFMHGMKGPYTFPDVEKKCGYARELSTLYKNGKRNFRH